MPQNMMTIVMLVVLAALVFFMFRNSRKRQRAQQELQDQVVPGAEVMTNFGLYGTVVSIDVEDAKVQLETSPGNVLTIHRQAIARVETPVVTDDVDDTDEIDSGVEPEYGERIDRDDDSGDAADK